MNILYFSCHSILEYDEIRLFHSLGHNVASLGGYIDPAHPHTPIRPPLPDIPVVELVKREVDALGQQGHVDTLAAAKRHVPDAILEWADVLIVAGMEHSWIQPQWDHIKHKRVVWRTIGQSAHPNEWMMSRLRPEGLQIVRYSPREAHIDEYCGADALIRFYKDPDDFAPWVGDQKQVINISQNLYARSLADDMGLQPEGWQFTSFSYWQKATWELPAKAMGTGSEDIGGTGELTTEELLEALRRNRAFVNTGTQPASYTLGLMEAMMAGIPVVSIGPSWYRILSHHGRYGPLMFEGHEIAPLYAERPEDARELLIRLLDDDAYAAEISKQSRDRAIHFFGRDKIATQWRQFLDGVEGVGLEEQPLEVAA